MISGYGCVTLGIVVALLGYQLRAVETYELNAEASRFVETRLKQVPIRQEGAYDTILPSLGPTPRKRLTHPRWVGLAFMSIGAVLILHGISVRRQ